MYKFSSFSDKLSTVDPLLQNSSQLVFDSSVCITKFGLFCLSDLPLFNLESLPPLSPTKDVHCLNLSLPGMSKPGITSVFVVNALAVEELAELLGQLRTSDLSILLIPTQWFNSEKGDSNITKLSFSSFPLLLPKSWCDYLFLCLNLYFPGRFDIDLRHERVNTKFLL